jgi:hypothetical protein
MQKNYFKSLVCFLLLSFLFLSFAPLCLALDQPQIPKDTTEAKDLLQGILGGIPRVFSNALDTSKEFFYKHIYPYLDKEVEKRKPSVQKELNKEVNELKDEAMKEAPSLWQRFWDLIHKNQ